MDKDLIIKALECCYTDKRTCSDCPFQDPDKYMECSGLALSALELIKELTEENKSLTATVKTRGETIENLQLLMSKVNEDNERLTEKYERLQKALNTDISIVRFARGSGKTTHLREVGRIRADAIKIVAVREMRERLTAFFENDETVKYVEVDAEYINSQIDRITKEMEEGL